MGGKQKSRPGPFNVPWVWDYSKGLGLSMIFGRWRTLTVTGFPQAPKPRYRKRVIHMAANIAALLDKAKVIHRLSSDYKLALVMGVKPTTLANYRNGKTLPDARVIGLICDLTGDDAAILAAEIEEQRANTDEARALWHQVAQRLQAAAATAVFAVAFVVAGWVGSPMGDALAKAQTDNFSSYTS